MDSSSGVMTFVGAVIFLFHALLHTTHAQLRVHFLLPNSTDADDGIFKLENLCSTNETICYAFGTNCECQHDGSSYQCICPSALDYTLRLAAGIGIILLLGVVIMLVFTLYRRAMMIRRTRRRFNSNGSNSSVAETADPPPLYTEINIVSTPVLDATDFEKLPTYDEAVEYLKAVTSPPNSTLLVLNTDVFLNNSNCEADEHKGDCSPPSSSVTTTMVDETPVAVGS